MKRNKVQIQLNTFYSLFYSLLSIFTCSACSNQDSRYLLSCVQFQRLLCTMKFHIATDVKHLCRHYHVFKAFVLCIHCRCHPVDISNISFCVYCTIIIFYFHIYQRFRKERQSLLSLTTFS